MTDTTPTDNAPEAPEAPDHLFRDAPLPPRGASVLPGQGGADLPVEGESEAAARLATIRAAYDVVADDYERIARDDLDGRPLDRAMLGTFAELVRGRGRVADLGCGPGRVTGHLHGLGLDVFGLDLSPGMVATARRAFPELHFVEGSMTALDLPDGSLAGSVAWYSTVHTPPGQLPAVFAECARVLAPGGHFLIAFKAGNRLRRLERAYGHAFPVDVWWTDPEEVVAAMEAAGLVVDARLIREPDAVERATQGRQCYLLAHKPQPAAGQDGQTPGEG